MTRGFDPAGMIAKSTDGCAEFRDTLDVISTKVLSMYDRMQGGA